MAEPTKIKNLGLYLGIILLVIIIAGFFLYNYFKKPASEEKPPTKTNEEKPPTKANDTFPLVRGSEGENVRYLQDALLKLKPNFLLKNDGKFGPLTYTALLLIVGTQIDVKGKRILTYPVTQAVFNEILHESQNPATIQMLNPIGGNNALTTIPTYS